MAQTELAVILGAALLLGTIIFLSYRLAATNRALIGWANKCLEHTMAWHIDQREYMRTRLEAEQAEVLLREGRDAARKKTGVPPEPENDGTDIRVNTGVVMD